MTEFSPKLPVWYQLAMLLRSEIQAGRRAGGSQVEPELQLAARYGVSVMPVRQALKALEEEGLLSRQRGRGTFVTAGRQVGGHTTLESLYRKEFETPAEILERGSVPPPDDLAAHFADLDHICFFRRLAFRDGQPWSYGTLYHRPEFDAEMKDELLPRHPSHRILRERCGLVLADSTFTVRASAASPDVARHLRIDPFAAVLNIRSLTRDSTGRAIGASDISFVGDQAFSFEVSHLEGS